MNSVGDHTRGHEAHLNERPPEFLMVTQLAVTDLAAPARRGCDRRTFKRITEGVSPRGFFLSPVAYRLRIFVALPARTAGSRTRSFWFVRGPILPRTESLVTGAHEALDFVGVEDLTAGSWALDAHQQSPNGTHPPATYAWRTSSSGSPDPYMSRTKMASPSCSSSMPASECYSVSVSDWQTLNIPEAIAASRPGGTV